MVANSGFNVFSISTWVRGLVGAMAFLLVALRAAQCDELLPIAVEGNTASVAAFHSLACKAECRAPNGRISEAIEYWRSGEKIRVRCRLEISGHGSVAFDCWVQGGRITTQTTTLGTARARIQATVAAGLAPTLGDIWAQALFSFPGPDGKRLALSDLVAQGGSTVKCERVGEDGKNYLRLKLTTHHGRYDIWLGEQQNYLVKRLVFVMTVQGKEHVFEQNVTRFFEPVPGIFFPEEVEGVATEGGKQLNRRFVSFSQVAVNQPIAPELFQIQLVPGILVTDTILGKVLRSTEDGTIGGPATTPDGRPFVIVTDPPMLAGTPRSAVTLADDEPRNWWLWGSVGVVALGLLLIVRQRWRLRLSS